jgi:hypothetical protein
MNEDQRICKGNLESIQGRNKTDRACASHSHDNHSRDTFFPGNWDSAPSNPGQTDAMGGRLAKNLCKTFTVNGLRKILLNPRHGQSRSVALIILVVQGGGFWRDAKIDRRDAGSTPPLFNFEL